jgi:GLPGLI family protein
MKSLIFCILITLSFFSNAQEPINYDLEISYDINYNTARPNVQKGTLYIDASMGRSFFLHGKDTERKVEFDDKEETDINSNVATATIIFGGSKRFVYVDTYKDSLYTKDNIFSKQYLILEKTPAFKWVLGTEQKTLNNLVLKKATLNFRGRAYEAWYSEDYPVRFGPWKFQGLPGLIMEIYDTTKTYHFQVTAIKKTETKTLEIASEFTDLEIITIKAYPELRFNTNPIMDKVLAKLPRGATAIATNVPRTGIEIQFEWEEERKED